MNKSGVSWHEKNTRYRIAQDFRILEAGKCQEGRRLAFVSKWWFQRFFWNVFSKPWENELA